jgi:hypothetical protein
MVSDEEVVSNWLVMKMKKWLVIDARAKTKSSGCYLRRERNAHLRDQLVHEIHVLQNSDTDA